MVQVNVSGRRASQVAVSTAMHRSASTWELTAYVTVGYIPWRDVRLWRRTVAHVRRLVRLDIPEEATVKVAFVGRDGRPGKVRTIRRGRDG